MSLPGSPVSGGPRWAPTHVQVTVLRARGLRSKAKGGSGGSDAYAVMALGKEKFATSVAERCLGSPVWREEATFELPPPPRRTLSGAGEGLGPIAVLQLTVFHRALLGLDKFLGRAEISLAELQSEGGRRTTRWYKLHSKPGKKEKERGEIEVDIQFMRSNMTASMFDLSMKDKSRSPFGKLKDKLKGKRGNGLPDTASAIIPSITHSPADSDEESNEKEKKKSKLKTLFSKHGLQKGNLSQSMSVLPTLQPVSERVRLRPSDFQSQWGDDDDDDTLTPVSEKPSINRVEDNVLYPPSGMSHKRTGSADSKQLNQITSSNTKKDAHSLFGGLKPKNDPASRSNVCINGSHVYLKERDSKSDIIPKDPTLSSPSPQAFKRKQLSLSQENVSSDTSKEPEMTGRVPLESSSLESFKAMTLPSYKLLSGGDLLESSIPVSLDTCKETKENKKQENKKSSLLSLVTGKKEPKASEEAGNGADVYLKLKEAKCNDKELIKKETPFGVPADCKRDCGPDKNSAAVIPVAKASLNPFSEDVVEEQKPEKSAASVKPSQTKPVKPRLDVSSEDETKAILTIPVSPSASSFCPSHHSSNDNPFISKLGSELKIQDSDGSASPSFSLPTQPNNNPFSLKWGQETKEQDPKYFTAPSFCLPSPPSGSENNPFASKWVQESQLEDSEHTSKSPLYFPHPPITSVLELHSLPSELSNVDDPFKLGKDSECVNNPPTSLNFPSADSGQDNTSSIGNIYVVPSEELQNESITNQTDAISSFPGSLSVIHPVSFYGKVGLIRKTQHEDKVNIVTPFKENNGSVKKSVTFALDELKYDDSASSGNEDSDEDPDERWYDENEDAIDPTISNRRQRFELNIEHCSLSKPNDGRIHSVQISGNSLERETETSSFIRVEPPVPTPRVLVSSPKETQLPGTVLSNSSLSLPPKPAPRSALKHPKHVSFPLTDEPKIEETTNSASELGLLAQNSVISSEKLTGTNSLTMSVSTTLHPGRDDDTFEKVQDINNDNSKYAISMQYSTSGTGELNQKLALPVILEVGSDDEQLSDYQKDAENMAVCEDLSRAEDSEVQSSVEERGGVSDKEATHVSQTLSLLNKVAPPNDAYESNKSSVDTSGGMQNASHNIRGTEQNNEDSFKESRQGDCPEFSNKTLSLSPLSSSSELYSASSLQSETLSSNKAESPKKATAEGLDAKVEISGKKKLLQAWVSPSETHSNQTLQSGGTYPAKLRLHPVKPMNTTSNKSPAKTLNIATKILDNQNETSLKKYNPSDPAYAYAQLTHDELIQLVLKQKDMIAKRDLQVRELEDYIDNLLVRVMEETPNILRVAHANKKAGKM